MASRPLSAETMSMSCSSSSDGQGEDVAHVVVDDQHLLARAARRRPRAGSSSASRCASGSLAGGAVQEERSPGRAAARASAPRAPTLAPAQPSPARPRRIAAVAVDDDRHATTSDARDVAFAVEHAAGEVAASTRRAPRSRPAAPASVSAAAWYVAGRDHLRRRRPSRYAQQVARAGPVSTTPRAGCASVRVDERADAVEQRVEHRPCAGSAWRRTPRAGAQRALARLVGRDDAHRDVPRGRGRSCSRSSTRQPSMSGRWMSSVMASGLYSRVRARADAPQRGDQPLEALLAGRVEQEAGEARGRSRRSAARGRRAGCRRGRRRPR